MGMRGWENGTRVVKIRELASEISIPIEKITLYALNPAHPRGRNKAVLFAKLGYTQANAEALYNVIATAVRSLEAVQTSADEFGVHYAADFWHRGPTGLNAEIRTVWLKSPQVDIIRMTSLWIRRLAP
jgi:hypothetical protein